MIVCIHIQNVLYRERKCHGEWMNGIGMCVLIGANYVTGSMQSLCVNNCSREEWCKKVQMWQLEDIHIFGRENVMCFINCVVVEGTAKLELMHF